MKFYPISGAAALVLALAAAGCGGAKEEAKPVVPAAETSASPAKSVPDLSSAGSLAGRVTYAGPAPEAKKIPVKGNPECSVLHPGGAVLSEELIVSDGGLANAFVYVKEGLESYSFPAPAGPVTIANTKCIYVPHVSGAQTGQDVVFLNNDATLHNIHAYPKNNKVFNLGLPIVGMKQTKKFTQSEVMVPLKCDVHPWMLGYIGVVDHPYFAVSGADGRFEIKNLPAGEYTLEVWHEKLGTQTQKVKIEPQAAGAAEFNFPAA